MLPEFRRVGEEAADLLTRIHEECFPKYWNREAFTDFFAVEHTFTTLVLSPLPEGEAMAMMVYRIAGDQADIITLAVRPAFQRRGLAASMLGNALADCRELGVEKMFLEVEADNAAAITLYEHAGFTHVTRRKLYYQQLDGSLTDALVMSKKLGYIR